jgi:hypothetical protein
MDIEEVIRMADIQIWKMSSSELMLRRCRGKSKRRRTAAEEEDAFVSKRWGGGEYGG